MNWPSGEEIISESEYFISSRPSLRDAGLLRSAIDSARNLHAYGTTDLFELAAHLMAAIIQNHPMIDGNKRLSWVSGCLFLKMNGLNIRTFTQSNGILPVEILKKIASGDADVSNLASFLAGACDSGNE